MVAGTVGRRGMETDDLGIWLRLISDPTLTLYFSRVTQQYSFRLSSIRPENMFLQLFRHGGKDPYMDAEDDF